MQKLSRDEMKKVLGGVLPPPSGCAAHATNCTTAKCSCSGTGTNTCGASDDAAECDCDGTKTTVTCPSLMNAFYEVTLKEVTSFLNKN